MEIRPRDKMTYAGKPFTVFSAFVSSIFSFTITFSIISTPFSEAI